MAIRAIWAIGIALALALSARADAHPLPSISHYTVEIGTTSRSRGDLHPGDFTFAIRSDVNQPSLKLFATIQSGGVGHRRMLGALSCTLGPIAANQLIFVQGSACDGAPSVMRSAGALRAGLSIADPSGRTGVVYTDVPTHAPTTANIALAGVAFDASLLLEPEAFAGDSTKDRNIAADLVAVFVRASERVDAVNVDAEIGAGTDGPDTPVGAFHCHFGPLEAGQGAVYHGNNCDGGDVAWPANTNLFATLSVSYAGGSTVSRLVQIQEVRVGMPWTSDR